MSATIRVHGPNGILATVKSGVWTSEVELLAQMLNNEMKIWEDERPLAYELEQDKTDALHVIEKFFPDNGELIEYIPPSTEGHHPDTIY